MTAPIPIPAPFPHRHLLGIEGLTRPDTLALLQRDAGQLQQALTQAGLDPSAGGVNLSLRSDSQTGGQTAGQPGGGDARQGSPWASSRADTLPESAPVQILRGYGGLDIRI